MTSILFFIVVNKSIVEQFCEPTFIFVYSVSYLLLCISLGEMALTQLHFDTSVNMK